MNTHAPSPNRSASRDALCAQIQEAWTQHHNIDLPLQLANENPDLADDLLSFFDRLVSSEIEPPTGSEQEEAARRLTARLRQTGQSHLADAVDRVREVGTDETAGTSGNSGAQTAATHRLTLISSPGTPRQNFMTGQRQAEGRETRGCEDYYDYAALYDYGPDEIAEALDLPTATAHKLIVNSTECPPRAQDHIARTTAAGLPETDYPTALMYLVGGRDGSTPRQYPIAASRTSDYGRARPFSYEATFENAPSGLSAEQRRFWLSLADDPTPSSE